MFNCFCCHRDEKKYKIRLDSNIANNTLSKRNYYLTEGDYKQKTKNEFYHYQKILPKVILFLC